MTPDSPIPNGGAYPAYWQRWPKTAGCRLVEADPCMELHYTMINTGYHTSNGAYLGIYKHFH